MWVRGSETILADCNVYNLHNYNIFKNYTITAICPAAICTGMYCICSKICKYCFQSTYPINTCIDMYDYSIWISWKYTIFFATVVAPQMVSPEPLTSQGAVRVTWSPPADLCGLTNPQYTIQYGRKTSTLTTHILARLSTYHSSSQAWKRDSSTL